MKSENIKKLFGRIDRIKNRLGIKCGVGTSWVCSFENGEIHKYTLKGVKFPEEIEDDIASAFIWLWSIKDNIKKMCKDDQWVEAQVNSNPYLCICADLANALKHGGLDRKSRSGKNPMLGKLKYKIPQAAIKELSFGASTVGIDINNAHLVEWGMPILDDSSNSVGDAFEYLDHCLNAWDLIIESLHKESIL
ncbi:hypothetical protein DRJ25_06480 [Candidatus Woesearchaeota archaeon]|nr:MAG: hypothetical protein DRJ25_06480 [Candidatus Woesearchaeota archaeon]